MNADKRNDLEILNAYHLMNNNTGEFVGVGSTIKSIKYYDLDTKETKIEHNVFIMDIDCFGIEVQLDNGCYDNIDVCHIKELEI